MHGLGILKGGRRAGKRDAKRRKEKSRPGWWAKRAAGRWVDVCAARIYTRMHTKAPREGSGSSGASLKGLLLLLRLPREGRVKEKKKRRRKDTCGRLSTLTWESHKEGLYLVFVAAAPSPPCISIRDRIVLFDERVSTRRTVLIDKLTWLRISRRARAHRWPTWVARERSMTAGERIEKFNSY